MVYFKRKVMVLKMENKEDLTELEIKKDLITDINNPKKLLQLGEIYYSSNRLDLAVNCLSHVMNLVNNMAHVLYNKANQLLILIERDIQINNNDSIQVIPGFLDTLLLEILNCVKNHYPYNIDIELFELMRVPPSNNSMVVNIQNEKENILKHIQGLEKLYFNLNDQFSKELLIKLLTFRLLGNHKIKLPLNNMDYWLQRKSIHNLIQSTNTLQTNYHN